jgi:hypothetical protein
MEVVARTRALGLDEPNVPSGVRRQRLGERSEHESSVNLAPLPELGHDRPVQLDGAVHDAAVGELEPKAVALRGVGRAHPDKGPADLRADEPPAEVDQVEAAVLAHAVHIEKDRLRVEEGEALDRRDSDPRDSHSPLMIPRILQRLILPARTGKAVEWVREMKATDSKSMRTIGSLTLCRSLLNAGLVDRFRVVVFPVITGRSGRQRIYDGYPDVALEMIGSRTFDGRIQLLEYVPAILPGPPGSNTANA